MEPIFELKKNCAACSKDFQALGSWLAKFAMLLLIERITLSALPCVFAVQVPQKPSEYHFPSSNLGIRKFRIRKVVYESAVLCQCELL